MDTGLQETNTADDPITRAVIGAAIQVHRALGPGLLESAYRACLTHELALVGVPYKAEVDLPVTYKGVHLDCGYRMDLVVADSVIVELKAVERLLPIHQAQLLTYMRLAGRSKGLLLNFNSPLLKDGIMRLAL
ncbi:MAG: GxxExxY protein [Phycisphaerales bacterium]|nr:GxxExxY protein [Phycisphaerales bacterium]